MRIIAGKLKRRTVRTISSQDVRPTTDRVRQTLFDTLAARIDFENLYVLDLFAGSGILGIEALSRGAAFCTFVEHLPEAARAIQQSLAAFSLSAQAKVWRIDAMHFLDKTTEQYDLIFADPPYKFSAHHRLLEKIFSRNLLREGGYLVLEHHRSQQFAMHREFELQKTFGTTVLSFFSPNDKPAPAAH
ncbi:MAG: 16S rRNA (guanine(966)-N(2))-methyltransferase RsmD [Chloroherpetonaceae bacterium]|nr:16S rRNA (guanine(966)-N(2))-methyltransferase RsmD [Chloroherpetonaceae bacterium]MCS7212147.1 16S rRNA (guanine(966)-N(2))-methyltransferase RsmD [Chloroherpetonaceae bacterium]MDW8020996.1 16S rRNA (guanine(966)-N(2))-methyltransferase RsmD [Chloroherpetonaceae bacterium]